MTYASQTAVPVDRSKSEIERILDRYGATHFGYVTMPEGASVQFVKTGKRIRFLLPIPEPPKETAWNYRALRLKWEQLQRSKWRALCLVIKAKLEAVESGVCTFEEEFFAHLVLPNGKTVSQHILPQIEEAYASGKVPALGWGG